MADWDSFRRLFHPRRILWQSLSGFYCVGLDELCPIWVVACLDHGREYGWIEQRTGIGFCSVEKKTGSRAWPRESVMEDLVPSLREELTRILHGQPHWVAVSPYVSQSLADFAAQAGHPSACHPPELCEWLSHKANFLAGMDGLGLPRPRGRWTRLSENRYAELSKEMGSRLVAQLPKGGGGSGTVFIRSESDFSSAGARLGEAPVWVAPELGELSLNINAVAMSCGAVAAYPSVQLVGLEMLHSSPGMYCGNDYSATAAAPAVTLGAVREQTERIGQWLASLGYRGLFGLDFVLDPSSSQVYAVDLNPRWQGSTALLTQAQLLAGRLPLAAAELAYRLGVLSEAEVFGHRDRFFESVRGSQMCLRWDAPGWWEMTGDLQPGVYSLGPESAFVRPGIGLSDCHQPEEMLVTGAVPHPGTRIGTGAFLLRVYSQQPVLDMDRMAPLSWSQSATEALYQRAALRPVA